MEEEVSLTHWSHQWHLIKMLLVIVPLIYIVLRLLKFLWCLFCGILPAKSLWNRWKTGTVIILLAASAPEVLPILSGIVLPLLDGGRGGVADTARLDWDFSPKRKGSVRFYIVNTLIWRKTVFLKYFHKACIPS